MNKDNKYYVYMHISPSGKRYIGITSKKPEHRWNHGKAYWQNQYFTNAINKYGWDNFKHNVLFSNLSKKEACEKEKALIALYKSNNPQYGYNLSQGGENPAEGVKHSEETKARMSLSRTGQKRTKETCMAISSAKKGRTNGLNGRIGQKCSKAGIVLQIDETSKKVVATYYGYYEMNRMTGYAQTPIKEAVCGKRKRAYGFLWQYEKRGNKNVTF